MENPKSKSLTELSGRQIFERLQDGQLLKASTSFLEKVRNEVSEACEELIQVGARIRPLYRGKTQIGWIRSVNNSERKLLKKWVYDDIELLNQILLCGTSLTQDKIDSLSTFEIKSIMQIINEMGSRDISLFPYLSAFTTTSVSENLWHVKHNFNYDHKIIELPYLGSIKIITMPDHFKMWSTLCYYREQNKQQLSDSMQSLTQVRVWVGSKADPYANELKTVAKSLQPDDPELWRSIVKPKFELPEDGWARGGLGQTTADILKDLQGMVSMDKHERFMKTIRDQEIEKQEQRRKTIEELKSKHSGLIQSQIKVLTKEEIDERKSKEKSKFMPAAVPKDKQ